jgi:nucleotide-binding universal stress UspA family protein
MVMKILAPTDFSGVAQKSVEYALQLAKKINAEVVLFHSSHLPIVIPGTPLSAYDNLLEQNQEMVATKLEAMSISLQKTFSLGPGQISTVSAIGFAADEIVGFAEEAGCDLIVMGTTGASGLKKLIGSTTSAVVKNSKAPVISVPDNYHTEKELNVIVLATDYKSTAGRINLLASLAKAFAAEVKILHIQGDDDFEPNYEELAEGLMIKEALKPFKHSFHSAISDDIVKAIHYFAKENKADLITLFSQKQDLIEQLFLLSTSRELTLVSEIPLLVIPTIEA